MTITYEIYAIRYAIRVARGLRVHTKRGWVVLASDAVHVYDETDDERPFAIFYDLADMIDGYRGINQIAGHRDLLVPGHDARVTKAYPAAAPGTEGRILRLDLPPQWPTPKSSSR